MIRSLVLVGFFLCLAVADWTIVQNNYETIAMATSFVNSTGGWVAGGTASLEPLFLFTENGGSTFTNLGLSGVKDGAFLSIRTAGPTWGVAGGFGFFGLPCGAYTNDGSTWQVMEERGLSLVCAFQGASAVNDGKTGVLVGSWSHSGDWDGNGIEITTDGGSHWNQINGDTGSVPVRYASFLSQNLGYVTAGIWPSETDSVFEYQDGEIHKWHMNHRVSYNAKTHRYEINHQMLSTSVTGYAGLIAEVTNSGNTWSVLLNQTNSGFYFNEIACVDSNNCWAVTQGINSTGGDTGSIYYTSNGWSSYSVQYTAPGSSLNCISMLNSTYGWVGGALLSGDVTGDFDGQFFYTTDGKTWNFDSQIKNFYPLDISVAGVNSAFAAGITPIGLSSFAAYTS